MASQPVNESCANCSAWIDSMKDSSRGYCKAHPPTPLFGANFNQPGSGTPQIEYYFPITMEFDWCREFAAIEVPSSP